MKVHGKFMTVLESVASAIFSVIVTCAVVAVGGLNYIWTAVCLALALGFVFQSVLWLIARNESSAPMIAGLAGVFLGGAICRIPVVIDGFISSVAALCAARLAPDASDYMLPSHRSGEPAGGLVLEALGLSPFLECNMSLGEGSGAVAVIPLLEMGLEVYRKMSTFDEIHVQQYEELK